MANTKVSDLDEMTVPLSTDELLVIDDPGGTPASQRVSLSNLLLATAGIIPTCYVYNNANISIAHNVATDVTFNSEILDTDTMHDTVSNAERLIAPIDGTYFYFSNLAFASNATGARYLNVFINATPIFSEIRDPLTGLETRLHVAGFINMSATDYVKFQVHQLSGGSLDLAYAAQYNMYAGLIRIGD